MNDATCTPDAIYHPSQDVVAREIEGELVIVPLTAGVGDLEDELYTLNETGRAIWDLLDGRRSLKAVAEALSAEYEADADTITQDVLGLVTELVRRKMLVKIGPEPAE
jgi:hypothetical protein